MRILFCLSEPPQEPFNGFQLVAHHLVRELSRRHTVRVLALAREPRRPTTLDVPHRVVHDPPSGGVGDALDLVRSLCRLEPLRVDRAARRLSGPLRQELTTFCPDVVHVSHGVLARLGPDLVGTPAVLACLDAWHRNVEARIAVATGTRRVHHRTQRHLVRRFEAHAYGWFPHLTTVTDADADALRDVAPCLQISVIGNGVELPPVRREPPRGTPRLLFHGAMGYPPNVRAAQLLAEEVLPRVRAVHRGACLDVVGRAPAPTVRALGELPGVRVHGEVPSLAPAMAAASVYVCPMVTGTGIKNKLLEAMAHGVPSVATPLALQGIAAAPGVEVLVGETPDELAQQVLVLLEDAERAAQLGAAGRELVRRHHAWDSVARAYEEVYAATVDAVRDSDRSGPSRSTPPPLPAPYDEMVGALLGDTGVGQATRRWAPRELIGSRAPTVLWGAPTSSGRPVLEALKTAVRREAALARTRFGGVSGYRRARVHRQRGSASASSSLTSRVSGWLRAGAFVELRSDGPGVDVLLDRVLQAADASPDGSSRVTAGGVLLWPVQHASGPALLRIGRVGGTGDPARAADVLRRLETVRAFPTPRLLAVGTVEQASWTLEARLPGAPPRTVSPSLFAQVLGGLTSLPSTSSPAGEGLREDLASIRGWLPEQSEALRDLTHRPLAVLSRYGAVLGHGDLWSGNLLEVDGRLTGIVDWDGWRPATAPGVDALQLFASTWRRALDEPLGTAWLRRPWASRAFLRRSTTYWEAMGVRPDPSLLAAVGIAWWAQEVAGTLRRYPRRRDDGPWLHDNVVAVLDGRPEG